MTKKSLKILAFGDVVGRTGREALSSTVAKLRAKHNADLVIANGENSAGGAGIDEKCAVEIHNAGVDVITLGDHTWNKKEIHAYLDKKENFCIRPGNYPEGASGNGYTIINRAGIKIGVMNVMGRLFIQHFLDCPFRTADKLLAGPLAEADIVICDMHAEATSEKLALGNYLDGRISLMFGTHTHVQTSDEQILPKGTGYISDLGMCGPKNSVLGLDTDISINRFITGMKFSYKLGDGDGKISGIFAEIDIATKKAIHIERLGHPD